MADDGAAFAFEGTTLYSSDIGTLAAREWVGDAILMLLCSLLEHDAQQADIQLWSPAVVQVLATVDDDVLDGGGAGLFPPLKRYNILPISDAYSSTAHTSPSSAASHWSLLLIHAPSPSSSSSHSRSESRLTAYHLDSLDPHNHNAAAHCAARFATALGLVPSPLRALGRHGWASSSTSLAEGVGQEPILQAQQNAWDCGIYVLVLTQAIVRALSHPSSAKDNDSMASPSAHLEHTLARILASPSITSPERINTFRSQFYDYCRRWQAEGRPDPSPSWAAS